MDIIFYGLCETIFFTKRYFKRFELETPDLNIGTANLLCCMNPQLSQDLIPVVYHDFELLASIVNKKGDRQMMVQMPLKNLTLEQLQQLKVHLGLVISTRGVSLSVHSPSLVICTKKWPGARHQHSVPINRYARINFAPVVNQTRGYRPDFSLKGPNLKIFYLQ